MEEIKKTIKSHGFKKILKIVVGFFIVLLIFQAGMFVGFKRAYFSDRIGSDYFSEMRGNKNNYMMGMKRSDFINSHGAIGKIVELKLPLLVVEDVDGVDKTIKISSSTQIKAVNDSKMASDLKLNDFVIVFGAEDDSVIDAKLLRIMPEASSTIIKK